MYELVMLKKECYSQPKVTAICLYSIKRVLRDCIANTRYQWNYSALYQPVFNVVTLLACNASYTTAVQTFSVRVSALHFALNA